MEKEKRKERKMNKKRKKMRGRRKWMRGIGGRARSKRGG